MTALTIWRVLVFVICLSSFVILCNRFRKNRKQWTAKTRDYWYAQTMWSFAGAVIPLEGILRHGSFRISLVFVTAAVIVNLIGLRRKGSWGTDNDR